MRLHRWWPFVARYGYHCQRLVVSSALYLVVHGVLHKCVDMHPFAHEAVVVASTVALACVASQYYVASLQMVVAAVPPSTKCTALVFTCGCAVSFVDVCCYRGRYHAVIEYVYVALCLGAPAVPLRDVVYDADVVSFVITLWPVLSLFPLQ
ncbi:hypothetical protein SPRG_00321 [Saprolegnia parasitica CBS 223.65]|uniref:Uncharacterized protein n=1 Tax=Saprolegnia parasitica (strain CBS 223.65) TaxID=695850 RepID=A0A067CXN6_SAPPC|nr:hypothetical protein SPRG_00321 [Saprolegnia parasitica CBS 223.65]KDO35474.1 hypothetical protein SPRG_00321 [Saprolegnia parasitica CBS 223.65]|eukprot:XP_012193811.1 hypothetical protein SPRG_00321 [Saprolegnia parasitica CBS 223.65]